MRRFTPSFFKNLEKQFDALRNPWSNDADYSDYVHSSALAAIRLLDSIAAQDTSGIDEALTTLHCIADRWDAKRYARLHGGGK